MSQLFQAEDGYYALTKSGTIAFMVIVALLIVSIAFLIKRETASEKPRKQKVFSARQLAFSAMAIALGFITSYIKIVHMPWGGSITLCSMLFVTLIGYWYGPAVGLVAGFAYGFLQFVQTGASYILSPTQACMDYILAFAALGLSGLFYRKTNGLIKGYLFAIFMRGVFHSIGGYLYWMDYMPDSFPQFLVPVYPIVYNYAYILAEGLITIVILSIPAVKNAMGRVKTLAAE
ncbi:MAG: energy-coupled thiamine transporter ThiT [Blautia sp.]|nr:energy-coupled thiamine transporter ThiT [Lachnoclostridium sp.]MCM1211239.1 energy-coupled thiamine transporter ThiT [Blautia sp.]